jgi:glyoxylase-like metal-dependent hydrolase (beta-lactamase superfamily II)
VTDYAKEAGYSQTVMASPFAETIHGHAERCARSELRARANELLQAEKGVGGSDGLVVQLLARLCGWSEDAAYGLPHGAEFGEQKVLEVNHVDGVLCLRMARTIFGRGRYFTAAYWVDGVMVDTGCAHALPEMLEAVPAGSVRSIVNTHSHEDHVGCNHWLKQRDGCEVYAHPLALPVLADPRLRGPLHIYRQVMWGLPLPCRGRPVPDYLETPNHRFKVLHTPGHSPDHIALIDEDRGWAFTADLFVGGKDRAARVDAHGGNLIASLEMLQGLSPTRLFPGSGHVRTNPSEEIARKLDYLRDLRERIQVLHGSGRSVGAIRRKLFPRPMFMEAITLADFSAWNLVRAFLKEGP